MRRSNAVKCLIADDEVILCDEMWGGFNWIKLRSERGTTSELHVVSERVQRKTRNYYG